MNLRTLLGWSLAATLLAACSGGGAGSVSPSSNAPANPCANTSCASFTVNTGIDLGSQSSSRRSPDYVGTNVNTIAYTFNPGAISGSFTSVTPGVFTGCVASGFTQTCNVALAPGTYSLTVTLKQGATTVGSGTNPSVVITSGNVTAAPIQVQPVASAPALSIPGSPKQFYQDGQMQSISLTANELDPASDIITTYYGPVAAYPALTFTHTGSATNVTFPANITVNTPPSAQGGYTGEMLTYTGSGANPTSLVTTLSDGVSTSSVTVPYVSLANNAANPSAGQITFSTTGASGNQTFTVTESTTAASGGLDTNLTSSSPNCGAHVIVSPTLGTNALTVAGPSGTVTYTVTAVDTALMTCTINVASVQDTNLTTAVTVNFPGTAGVGVSSHSRT
jgi:hypothetical protein